MPNAVPSIDERAYTYFQRTLVFVAALILTLIAATLLFALNTSSNRCQETQSIRAYILGATERGLETLPTLDYYKSHPGELKDALDNLRRQRAEFATPLDCSLL